MMIEYRALPPQYRFLRSRAQFAGLFGGIGSGKSHVGCFWALVKALRNPRCLGLIAANSYRQLKDATLRTFEMLLRRDHVTYEFKASDMAFRLANGAEILCRSLDSYDFLRGVELGWFYLDELRDTRFEAWQVVKGRLRSQNVDAREGRVTSSPNGYDWIYEEFIRKPRDLATAAAYANHEAFFARTADNKHLPRDYVAALLASYDPLLAAQELDGRFLNVAQGRVYPAFDRAVHLDSTIELDPRLPVCLALDFNVTPMTAVIAQIGRGAEPFAPPMGPIRPIGPMGPMRQMGPMGREETAGAFIRVIDELWLLHSSTAAMCEAFGEWLADQEKRGFRLSVFGYRGPENRQPKTDNRPSVPLLIYGDAAGLARSTVGKSDYAIIQDFFPEAELCVGTANPGRRDRYNAVNAALCDARGAVRLRIHPRCRHLVEDLERTVYQPDSNEPDTRDPLRGHISDALGYLVARVMPAGRRALGVGKW
jgi:phage terminase large subunit